MVGSSTAGTILRESSTSSRRWCSNVNVALSTIILSCLIFHLPGTSAWNCSTTSRDALLNFKAGLVDTPNLFVTWTTSLDCCLWQFVTCRESDGAVLQLQITGSSVSQPYRNTSYNAYTLGSTLVDLDQLQVLKIQWVLFNSSIPSRWSSFSNNLQNLTVNDANLRNDIPSSLSNIDYLQHLDLKSNHLTGSIPSSFCSMKHLTYLDVSYNDMSSNLVPTCLQGSTSVTLLYGNQGDSTSPGPPGTSGAVPSALLPPLRSAMGMILITLAFGGYVLAALDLL